MTTTHIVSTPYAVYEIEEYAENSCLIFVKEYIKPIPREACFYSYSKSSNINSLEEAKVAIAAFEKRVEVIEILSTFVTEMENYSYYGSNPGIPVDSLEEVAQKMIEHFTKNEVGYES